MSDVGKKSKVPIGTVDKMIEKTIEQILNEHKQSKKEQEVESKKHKKWTTIVAMTSIVLAITFYVADEPIAIQFDLNEIFPVSFDNKYFHTENGILLNNYHKGATYPNDKATFKIKWMGHERQNITLKPEITITQHGDDVNKIELDPVRLLMKGWSNTSSEEFFLGGEGVNEFSIKVDVMNENATEILDTFYFTKNIEVLSSSDRIQSEQNLTLLAGVIISAIIGGLTFFALYSTLRTSKQEVKQLEEQNLIMQLQNSQLQKQYEEQIKIMNFDVESRSMTQVFELLTKPEMKNHKLNVVEGYWAYRDSGRPIIFRDGSASTSAHRVKQALNQACSLYVLGLLNKEHFREIYGGTVVRFWRILEEDIIDEQSRNPDICKQFKTVAEDLIRNHGIDTVPYRPLPTQN